MSGSLARPAKGPVASAPVRILVVEDDPVSRRALEEPLRRAGYDVHSCCDGQEALPKLRELRPEVLVTDWEMPRLDGLTLCRIVKGTEELRTTHVIILSSRGETSSKVAGLDLGADDYLVKPADPHELLARVRAGLRLQRALVELGTRNELLEKLALSDPLTGLANRRAFEETLRREEARTLRTGSPVSLLFFDLDRFKSLNDSFGHAFGDVVLAAFAGLLSRLARRGDLPARIGGEEFALLLPDTPVSAALLVAERMRAAVEGAGLGQERGAVVTVSIGVAGGLAGEGLARRLFEAADSALYRAKAEGRNRVSA